MEFRYDGMPFRWNVFRRNVVSMKCLNKIFRWNADTEEYRFGGMLFLRNVVSIYRFRRMS